MRITKNFRKQMLSDIKEGLETYYRINTCKRNQWRFDRAWEQITKQIGEIKDTNDLPLFIIKGAQWGGKYGNYFRAIGYTANNSYIYIEGFKSQLYKQLGI